MYTKERTLSIFSVITRKSGLWPAQEAVDVTFMFVFKQYYSFVGFNNTVKYFHKEQYFQVGY